MGGETSLRDVGTFTLESEEGRRPIILGNVFAVEAGDLPAGVVALIGVSDVLRLGLSLDRIAAHPGCSLTEGRPLGVTGRLLPCLSGVCAGVFRLFRRRPPQGGRLPDAPPAHIELREFQEAQLGSALPLPRALAPEPRSPPSPRSNFLQRFRPTLEELKALHWNQQQARTRARIARLHSAPPPARANVPLDPRSPSLASHSSSSAGQPNRFLPRSQSLEALEPLMPRRGQG